MQAFFGISVLIPKCILTDLSADSRRKKLHQSVSVRFILSNQARTSTYFRRFRHRTFQDS